MGYKKFKRPLLAKAETSEIEGAGGGGGTGWSTDEVDTGLTWIDDRPVYKKTIDCGDLTGGSNKATAHGISNFEGLVGIEGGMEDTRTGNDKTYYPIPFASPSANIGVQVQVTPVNVNVFAGSYWNRSTAATTLNNCIITLYYVKTAE
jgi:hypothetical protein